MHGDNQTSEPAPHLAPALTALVLAVVVLAAFGSMPGRWKLDRSTALAAAEAVIDRSRRIVPAQEPGHGLATGGLRDRRLAAALRQLGAEHAPGLQSALSSDQRVPRSPHRVRDLPGGQGGHDLPDHPAEAGRGRPRAAGAESGGLPVALLVLRWAHGLGRRLRGQFLPLHAGELAFNTRLSLRLRQDAARRMLQYPATVADRPLLRFALENLADGSPLGLACYDAVLPLGMLQNAILRFQDHWNVVCYLWKHPAGPRPRSRRPAAGRWIGRVAPAGGRNRTVLNPTTTSSVWIIRGGTANFARKRSGRRTPGRTRRSSARSERTRNGSIWSFSCAVDRIRCPAAPAEHADPRRLV